MMRKVLMTFIVFLGFLFVLPENNVLFAQVDDHLNERLQNEGAIIVNHDDIYLFDQIPETYLQRARNIKMMFSDRSVGANTSEGLDCLNVSTWSSAPSHCRRDWLDMQAGTTKLYLQADYDAGTVPERILFNPAPGKYNRSNWTFVFKQGTWTELTDDFINNLAPSYLSSNNVLTYQFSYLNVDSSDNIASPTDGFFANTSRPDNNDLENYLNQHQDKVFIYWTTSLSRSIGTTTATNFNNQMRQYAINNKKLLIDFADIESHRDRANGYSTNDCSYNGNPAICKDYTTETEGGHLGSVSGGKIMVAKAVWIMMAQIAGWRPGTNVTPPPLPTLTPTPAPTQPPATTSPTTTPTTTPLMGDVNRDGIVNIQDYVLLSVSYGTSSGSQGYNQNADLNSDNVINIQDYLIISVNYGNSQ